MFSSRRILALFLPRLPTDRLHRREKGASWRSAPTPEGTPPEAPLAVFARQGAAYRLEAVDDAAESCGLAPGQPVAAARARMPGLRLVERDAAAELETLEDIADWCDRYTPLVALDGDFDGRAGLLLDVSGAAHLFGGEEALARDVVTALARQGFAARVALAETAAGARAVARHGLADGATIRIVPSGEIETALADLPLAAVDPDADRPAALARSGLTTVAAVTALPRPALARRFGRDLLDRLDAALGRLDGPISPRRTVPALMAERRFLVPIVAEDDLRQVVRSLAAGLADALEQRGEGLRLVELALHRVDGDVRRLRVGTGRPLRDPDLVVRLFAEKVKGEAEAIDTGFGFDLVRLSVLASGRDTPTQIDLAGDAAARTDFEHLIDRLGARLGPGRVTRARPGESHVPEAEVETVAARASGPDRPWPTVAADEPPLRPARLLARPEPIDTVAELADGPPLRFRWRRALYSVDRAEGPERIAAEWWRLPFGLGPEGDADALAPRLPTDRPVLGATRDYFRVEETSGRRFWIFRHGLFGRETVRPRWFLHGIFA